MKICDGYGEVKSFFVTDDARGKGIGGALLRQIEDQARQDGLTLLRLETAAELKAACRLYARNGFETRKAFGDYEDTDISVFMEKSLPDAKVALASPGDD